MAKGSFTGLYTFDDVAKIYKLDASTLRKRIQKNKFVLDKEVKKFGKTWLITEEAMINYFGSGMFSLHIEELTMLKIQDDRRKKLESKLKKEDRASKNKSTDLSGGDDDYNPNAGWNECIKGNVVSSFDFS